MKQVILVRVDLKMDKGKLGAQCGHACVDAVLNSKKSQVDAWKDDGAKKVVLKVQTVAELIKYKKLADKQGLVTALIKDAGKTFFKKPTITCLAIGPDDEDLIDAVTGELKMM
jgi:PTH2 family peptidyl-tRNA hydrolase